MSRGVSLCTDRTHVSTHALGVRKPLPATGALDGEPKAALGGLNQHVEVGAVVGRQRFGSVHPEQGGQAGAHAAVVRLARIYVSTSSRR